MKITEHPKAKRIDVVESPNRWPVEMTPEQARAHAADLVRLADHAERKMRNDDYQGVLVTYDPDE